MENRSTAIFVRAYDLDFDRIALSPKSTHEEKIRLLVLLRHTWTSGDRSEVLYEDVPPEQLDFETEIFKSEIERGLPLESEAFRDAIEEKILPPVELPKLHRLDELTIDRPVSEVQG